MINFLGNIPVSLWIAFVLAAIPSIPFAFVSLNHGMIRSAIYFLMPLALIGIALLAAGQGPERAGRRLVFWGIAVVYLAYCVVRYGSLGQYLLPASLVLFFAAVRAK